MQGGVSIYIYIHRYICTYTYTRVVGHVPTGTQQGVGPFVWPIRISGASGNRAVAVFKRWGLALWRWLEL